VCDFLKKVNNSVVFLTGACFNNNNKKMLMRTTANLFTPKVSRCIVILS